MFLWINPVVVLRIFKKELIMAKWKCKNCWHKCKFSLYGWFDCPATCFIDNNFEYQLCGVWRVLKLLRPFFKLKKGTEK